MSNKKKKRFNDYFASCAANDTYGTIFFSMISNPKFYNLSPATKYFYMCCRVQAQSQKGRACLFKHGEEEGETYTTNCFVFPSSHMELYGIDRRNGTTYMNTLIKAGFIEKREQNKHRKKVNVYAFSNKWKTDS